MNWKPISALVLSAAIVSGCSKESSPAVQTVKAAPKAESPAPVVTSTAPDFYETSGPLVVENQVDVLAQREGVLATVNAEVGQTVTKGQLLAQLDDRQLSAERDAAAAKLKSIEADIQNYEAAAKVLQSDYERDKEMFAAKLITEKQLEHSKYKMIGSGYELEREKQNAKNAAAALKALELELEKTRITAPFAGVVARRYVRAGQRLNANDRVFWVTATSPVNVQFTLPEAFAGKVSKGQMVSVLSSNSPGTPFAARVNVVSPVADPSSGTIEVIAQLENPGASLIPGSSVTVRVPKAK